MQDKANAIKHLKEHQKYPATREELVKECNELSDFSAEDKKWFEDNLPDGTYNSADDVTKALGWEGGEAQGEKPAGAGEQA